MACLSPLVAHAQFGNGSTANTAPDPGTVTNTPANFGRIKCWVSRSSDGAIAIYKHAAIAVSVWEEGPPGTLFAKFRRYGKTPETFSAMDTKIIVNTTTSVTSSLPILVRVLPIANRAGTYEMKYDHPSGSVTVGYLRFAPGAIGRSATDVVVRLKQGAVDGVVDPCSEPPIDDMGEEEEMDLSPISSKGPGSTLSFVAAPVAANSIPNP